MDANSNLDPSPFSSSNSPNVADTQRGTNNPSVSSRTAIPSVNEASRSTHRQASVALDAAYNRLRQVRRSLLDLSESLPVAISQLRLHVPEIEAALGHDADISPPEIQASSAAGHGEGFGAREGATWGRIHSGVQNDRSRPSVESLSRSVDVQRPASSSLGPSLNAPLTNQTGSQAGSALEDDGATLLGRRVAARLAVEPTIADGAAINRYRGAREVYEGAIDSIVSATRRYEEELERLGRVVDERRRFSTTGPLRTIPRSSPTSAYPSQDRHHVSLPLSSSGTSQTSQAPQGSSLHPPVDLGAANIRRQNVGPSERLSFLSTLAVPSSLAPSNNVSNRPLIFDESLSDASSELNNPSMEPRNHSVSESTFQGRNYVVHRTYNRDGEEHIHNITIDWGDRDPLSWLMPSPNTSRRHRIRFNSGGRQDSDVLRMTDPVVPLPSPLPPNGHRHASNRSNDPPQRRGWARLDLDGNEIPSDEEEQVERLRTESRLRALQHSQTLVQAGGTMPLPVSTPRLEIRLFQSTNRPIVLRHDPSLSYPADFLNPLPMPLSEMVESGNISKPKATLLPRHIIVAGR
ncbi:hypothetical protein Agabi119p4_709 [Agaricus bisporus var. burnettii]|uniref:Uncharacterized protein n=1 Tax=Agaricus bisporus var. burnettii TaxID=192524 RepID=A0A8H7FB73_AGABI|nr:hypothetical protein Agabi119p4_709 [Agaricus bisporus var. burnettii]